MNAEPKISVLHALLFVAAAGAFSGMANAVVLGFCVSIALLALIAELLPRLPWYYYLGFGGAGWIVFLGFHFIFST